MSARAQSKNDSESTDAESLVPDESNQSATETNKYRFRETSMRLKKIKNQQQNEITSKSDHKKTAIKRQQNLATKSESSNKTRKRRRKTIASTINLHQNIDEIESKSNRDPVTSQTQTVSNKTTQSLSCPSNKQSVDNKRKRRKTIASNELMSKNKERNFYCKDVFEFTDENDDLVYDGLNRKSSLFDVHLNRSMSQHVDKNKSEKLSAINLNKQHSSASSTNSKRQSLNAVTSSLNKTTSINRSNNLLNRSTARVQSAKRKEKELLDDEEDVHVDVECDDKDDGDMNNRNNSKLNNQSPRIKYSSVGGSETSSNNSNETCDDDCSNSTYLSLSSSNTLLLANNSGNHVDEQQSFLNKIKRIKT